MKKLKLSLFAFLTFALCSIVTADAGAREQIRVVGSSTVYPFVTVVAEQFGRKTKFKTPVVEATGTGGGLKLFCSEVDLSTPDAVNASRRITPAELLDCYKNGVNEIAEIKIGYDGIIIANSVKSYGYDFTLAEIFMALAAKVPSKTEPSNLVPNFYKTWDEINPKFPKKEIRVYGPPATSGTRDAFVELVMEAGCWHKDAYIKAYPDYNLRKKACHEIREDGAYIEAGENDNLIVQKLNSNPDSLGIFGYSFLEENANLVRGSKVSGIAPVHDTIADGSYVISRPLFVYFKLQHIGEIEGIEEFMKELVSSDAIAPFGYLEEKGLIPLPEANLKQIQMDVNQGKKLENLAEEEEQVLIDAISNIETAAGKPISVISAK
jgi:phosphate transport system substrate-binding protein